VSDAQSRPLPAPDTLTRPYWDAAFAERLELQRCDACGRLRCPPAGHCPDCGSDAFHWIPVSGSGIVYAFCVAYDTLVRGFSPPYVVAQVELPEQAGLRIVTNIVECDPETVHTGMPVEVVFELVSNDIRLPQFRPVAAI